MDPKPLSRLRRTTAPIGAELTAAEEAMAAAGAAGVPLKGTLRVL